MVSDEISHMTGVIYCIGIGIGIGVAVTCFSAKKGREEAKLKGIKFGRKCTIDILEIYLGDISKKLDLKENGRVAQMIFDELLCLSRTTVSWVFTFETLDTKQNTVEDQRILDYFKYNKKEKRLKDTTSAKCKIRFSEYIRDNFRSKITIPVNFEAQKSIRSNIAKCLYNRLDNILAKASYRERSAKLIIEDLNLVAPRYKYKSRRYKLLQTLQKKSTWCRTIPKRLFFRYRHTRNG